MVEISLKVAKVWSEQTTDLMVRVS